MIQHSDHRFQPASARGLQLTIAAALLATALVACREESTPSPPPPPGVRVETPRVDEVTTYFRYNGSLAASEEAEIRARVPGYLEKIEFQPSTDIEAGTPLFVIEQDPYRIEVERTKAAKTRADAELAKAEARLKRVEDAFAKNAVSELERIEQLAEVAERKADVDVAAAAVADAELNLSYTVVNAPIRGRIGEANVDVGNLVGAKEDTLLATIVRMNPIHAYFDVSEQITLQYLKRGDRGTIQEDVIPVEIGLANGTDYPFLGRIDFVDNQLDSTTGTLRVRAVIENADRDLYPGLFVRGRVPFETVPDAVLIRENAVARGLEGEYVLVLNENNEVGRRPVTLGDRHDGGWVHVLEGLVGDERYIVEGLQRARPGRPVTVLEPPADDAPPADPSVDDANPGDGDN